MFANEISCCGTVETDGADSLFVADIKEVGFVERGVASAIAGAGYAEIGSL